MMKYFIDRIDGCILKDFPDRAQLGGTQFVRNLFVSASFIDFLEKKPL